MSRRQVRQPIIQLTGGKAMSADTPVDAKA
jgi:hypothetical protein